MTDPTDQSGVRVLVVDDDVFLTDLVTMALRYEGFEVQVADSVAATLATAADFHPDLIMLDIMLPDGSGLDACTRLRRRGCDAPVIFLTAKDGTQDKIDGLTVGGDDYVTKPFSIGELIARARAVIRRTRHAARSAVLGYADLEIDEDRYEVRRAGRSIELTPTEFALLRYLVHNAEHVVSKRQILDHVWEYGFGGNYAVVHTYIGYLRRKIDSVGPRLIHTIPRVGYVLRLPQEP